MTNFACQDEYIYPQSMRPERDVTLHQGHRNVSILMKGSLYTCFGVDSVMDKHACINETTKRIFVIIGKHGYEFAFNGSRESSCNFTSSCGLAST